MRLAFFKLALLMGCLLPVAGFEAGEVERVLVPGDPQPRLLTDAEGVEVKPGVEVAAFLGVQTEHLPASLAWHLKLSPGFGLMVGEVMEGSPAAQAGIRQYDVLLRYQDQQLVNMEQLQVLVRSGRKGDRVKLLVVSQGDEKEVTVILDEGPVEVSPALLAVEDLRNKAIAMLGTAEDWERRQKDWKERTDRMQDQLKVYQQQLESWVKNGKKEPPPEAPELSR